MIIVDQVYAAAALRTAQSAEKLVRKRFREVCGDDGDRILNDMVERMNSNIQSDGRQDGVVEE